MTNLKTITTSLRSAVNAGDLGAIADGVAASERLVLPTDAAHETDKGCLDQHKHQPDIDQAKTALFRFRKPTTKEQIESSVCLHMHMAVLQAHGLVGLITKRLSEMEETLSTMLEDFDTDAFWHNCGIEGTCKTQLIISGLFDALAEIDICQRIYQATQEAQKPEDSSDDDDDG